ncbi:MAG: hypothetical protein AAB482_02040 [Patescibacteria group bacterium]
MPEEIKIRTMKTDTDELLKKEKSSFLDMFARQSDERYEKGYHPTPQRPRSSGPIIVSILIILILIGGGAGVYFYINQKPAEPKPAEIVIPRPIINSEKAEKTKTKIGDRSGLLINLEKERQTSTSELRLLPITLFDIGTSEHLATPKDFFTTLRIAPPPAFYEVLTGKWNLYTQNHNFIFLFEINNRLKTLGTMLEWEEAMPATLGSIINRADIGTRAYKDLIIKNVDSRISLATPDDATQWGYSIVVGKYLVITTSESELKNAIERIVAGPLNE